MMVPSITPTRELQTLSSEKRIDTVIHGSLSTPTSYLVLGQMDTLADAQQRLADAWAAPTQGSGRGLAG